MNDDELSDDMRKTFILPLTIEIQDRNEKFRKDRK